MTKFQLGLDIVGIRPVAPIDAASPRSPQLPLLPNLDKVLHLLRSMNAIVDKSR
jgi:hypothetical protein